MDTAPYIDDTIRAVLPDSALCHYQHLLDLTTIITWIGVIIDTIRLAMAIDPSKVEEAKIFFIELLAVNTIPVKPFQSFLGKLFHATKCTTGARIFISILLDALATEHAGTIFLGPDAKADLYWFVVFLGQSDPHQALHRPAHHPRGLLPTGRWRPLLRIGVLQDPLPGLPPGFGPLHLQPRVLESPRSSSTVAPCPHWIHSSHLL